MNSTCIKHPARQPLIQIKAWQVYATDGDYCAAALLSFFEYWHNNKLAAKAQSKKKNNVAEVHGDGRVYDESLLQFQTEKDLAIGLLGLYRESKINDAIRTLKNKGFISVHENPNPRYKFDNTHYYLFHPETVQFYIDNHYPQRDVEDFDGAEMLTKFTKKRQKTTDREGNITSQSSENTSTSGNITGREGEITGTITKTTSEITTEITTDTLLSSPNGSDFAAENEKISSQTFPEKGNDISLPDKEEKTALVKKSQLSLSGKKLTKREIVNQKANDPEFINYFTSLRNNYSLYSGNRYLRQFADHRQQFYKTLAYRVANDDITKEDIENSFKAMTNPRDFSIMEFLGAMQSAKYNEKKILLDFLWIMLDGKVAAHIAEKKGAKELAEWIEDGKTTLSEVEDCFLWLDSSGRGYKRSLISLKAALSEFDRVKTVQGNGRFTGTSLNQNKTKEEKTVEILRNRDYDDDTILEKEKAYKDLVKSLTGK